MFLQTLQIDRITLSGDSHPVSIAHLDNFAMRNFTNDSAFDDTLPVADGLLEAGTRVPLEKLQAAMQTWFHRKHYLEPGETLRITALVRPSALDKRAPENGSRAQQQEGSKPPARLLGP